MEFGDWIDYGTEKSCLNFGRWGLRLELGLAHLLVVDSPVRSGLTEK